MNESSDWYAICLATEDKKVIGYLVGGVTDDGKKVTMGKEGLSLTEIWRLGPYTEEQAKTLCATFMQMPIEAKVKMLTEVPKGPIDLTGRKK